MNSDTPVALCVTCLVDQIMPEVGVAAARLLLRAGCAVDFPQAQTCCGQPFFNSGLRQEARRLAQRAITIFEPYEAIVLPSGSCTAMIRLEYPHLLADDPAWQGRALALAAKTYELSEFLTRQPGWQPIPHPEAPTVTYHDSCHMCRLLHLHQEPRALLAAAGCSLHEMAEPDRCCGFGGLFSLRLPEVANALADEKLRQATETGAETLVTADPGCLMHMRGLSNADSPRLVHLATLLDELSPEQSRQEARLGE